MLSCFDDILSRFVDEFWPTSCRRFATSRWETRRLRPSYLGLGRSVELGEAFK